MLIVALVVVRRLLYSADEGLARIALMEVASAEYLLWRCSAMIVRLAGAWAAHHVIVAVCFFSISILHGVFMPLGTLMLDHTLGYVYRRCLRVEERDRTILDFRHCFVHELSIN